MKIIKDKDGKVVVDMEGAIVLDKSSKGEAIVVLDKDISLINTVIYSNRDNVNDIKMEDSSFLNSAILNARIVKNCFVKYRVIDLKGMLKDIIDEH